MMRQVGQTAGDIRGLHQALLRAQRTQLPGLHHLSLELLLSCLPLLLHLAEPGAMATVHNHLVLAQPLRRRVDDTRSARLLGVLSVLQMRHRAIASEDAHVWTAEVTCAGAQDGVHFQRCQGTRLGCSLLLHPQEIDWLQIPEAVAWCPICGSVASLREGVGNA